MKIVRLKKIDTDVGLSKILLLTLTVDRVMLVVPLLNSSISILVWRSSCVSDLARTDSTFHRYGNSDTDFCD